MRGSYIVRFLISHTLRTIYNGLLSTLHMQSIVSGEVGYLQQFQDPLLVRNQDYREHGASAPHGDHGSHNGGSRS